MSVPVPPLPPELVVPPAPPDPPDPPLAVLLRSGTHAPSRQLNCLPHAASSAQRGKHTAADPAGSSDSNPAHALATSPCAVSTHTPAKSPLHALSLLHVRVHTPHRQEPVAQ